MARSQLDGVAQVRGVDAEHAGQVAHLEHLGGAAGHNVGQVPVDFAPEIGGDFVLPSEELFGDGGGHEMDVYYRSTNSCLRIKVHFQKPVTFALLSNGKMIWLQIL